jgi:hypothetical protein
MPQVHYDRIPECPPLADAVFHVAASPQEGEAK